ncbi:MAG: glycoside hydrolase family 68 protein [Nanoarchaeota archaeon]|nr:glycoside hydrolase family 68 protein [Nanoarchaeota archaeon]
MNEKIREVNTKLELYSPKEKIMWDSWFIKERNTYHSFYLQCTRTENPEERHDNHVSIGHAFSDDLINWKETETALEPGEKGEWDDLALWTGSVIKKDNRHYMFYTGRQNKKGENQIQKIGMAFSDDLINWTKFAENPVLKADLRYYDMNNNLNGLGKKPIWRDPYVFKDSRLGKYFMTISARVRGARREYNACIALAESEDLIEWKIHKPILSPGIYDEMETSQMVYCEGHYYLFFGVGCPENYSPDLANKIGVHTGLHCYYSKNLKGPYKPVNGNGIVLDNALDIYDIRLIAKSGNSFSALGWLNNNPSSGNFLGVMSSPFDIYIKGDRVEVANYNSLQV